MSRRGAIRAVILAAGTLLTVPGIDVPEASSAASDPRCFSRRVTLSGTAGDDQLRGTSRRDVIDSLGGDDRVTGLRGEDILCAGAGDDRVADVSGCCIKIALGRGRDRLEAREFGWFFAGRGNDVVIIDSPHHTELILNLGPGNDRVVASVPTGRPARFMRFGSVCVSFAFARNPVRVDLGRAIAQGQGRDGFRHVHCVYGSPHQDWVVGSAKDDYIEDAGGALHVSARGGDDYVNGSRGDDVVSLGPGDDTFNGGQGADRAVAGSGDDDLAGDEGVDWLYGGRGDDQVKGAYHCYSNSETLPVSDGSPNALFGGPGDDYLIGDVGNDLLDGGPGHDRGFGQDDGLLDTLVSLEEPTYC